MIATGHAPAPATGHARTSTTGHARASALTALCLLAAALTGALTGCAEQRRPTVSLSPDDTVKAAQLLLTDRCLIRQGLTPPHPGRPPADKADARRVDRALFAAGAGLATAGPASAANCPSGNFCVWTEADFGGQRMNASGDDEWWESWIADEDSSWANHGISGPGVKDHVKVYEDAIRWPSTRGDMTICLRPGDEVGYNATADDRGDAHVWAMGC